jgi:HEAT repeat protein
MLTKLILRTLSLLIVLAAAAYLLISWRIGVGVDAMVSLAQEQHAGPPVEALVAYAGSDANPLRQRNRAVWALGQLGDSAAQPFLAAQLEDRPCAHDSTLCQRELRKAVELCSGEPNITAAIWRR